MSEENVEIACRACKAAWRRPQPDFDTLNTIAHPEHEMFTIQSLVEGGGYHGARGFREWLASWGEMFGEDWEATVEQGKSLDAGQVLVTGQMKAQGQGAGVPVEQEFWVLMRLRDGKVTRSAVYTDRSQALDAAELRE